MKIEAIEVFHVSMPLVYPFRTTFGDMESIESVFVKMSGEGLTGWGESSPMGPPGYSSEYTAGAFDVIGRYLVDALLGRSIESGEQLQERLAHIKGNRFAKAALDLAWWDMHARSRDEPLRKTIGGSGGAATVGADLGVMEDIPSLLAEIGRALDDGFPRVKLKYRPGWELEMIRAVRQAFPDAVFHVDCNSAYTLEDLPMLEALDELDLAMVEQPLSHDDLVDHAELRRRIETPVCLDESAYSPDNVRRAIVLGSCDWVNIKHGRVGGLTEALKVHDRCRGAGIPNWIGGMLESSVGQSFSTALATLDNVRYPSDIFPTDRFYREDVGELPIRLAGPGRVEAFDGPGIGVRPDMGRLETATLQHARFP